MLQIITSVCLLILSINQIFLVHKVRNQRNAITAIMDLLIKKWSMEMQVGQLHLDAMIDETIEKIRRGNNDVD